MKGIVAFGIAVVIVASIFLVAWCVCFLGNWLSHQSSWTSRMKFKQWLELYYLCPGDWCLENTPNRYIMKRGGGGYWAYVHFSFLDYVRYQLWKKGAKRRKESVKRDKRLKDVLELAQSDIERLKQQADWEMEEAKRRAEETACRISETTRTASREVGLTTGRLPTSDEISHSMDTGFSPWFR